MNKKTITVASIIGMVFLGVMFFNQSDKPKKQIKDRVNWFAYDQGIEVAKENNMPVFLFFYADWCSYCEKMKMEAFQDESIANFLHENFISIQVDTDRERKTALKYKVNGLPTIWFLRADSTPITNIKGYVDEKMFLHLLRFIQSRAFEHKTFEEYKASLKM